MNLSTWEFRHHMILKSFDSFPTICSHSSFSNCTGTINLIGLHCSNHDKARFDIIKLAFDSIPQPIHQGSELPQYGVQDLFC